MEDIGCGEGITALGVARRFNPRSVRAVDIMLDPLQCLPCAKQVLGLEFLSDNLSLTQIEPGSFDLIYSWSVFEYIEQPLLAAFCNRSIGCFVLAATFSYRSLPSIIHPKDHIFFTA
ncbi:MAG: class I SAM-dependent methyltransferase [Nitrosomonas sp.]|nr:class I SAM-dependent methyltransferase [Nitrosomonas sp.]MBP7113074.1 class I SAM-dependent methyltransferase [Nitrosomonas sp.]